MMRRNEMENQVFHFGPKFRELRLGLDIEQRAELVPVVLPDTGRLAVPAGFCEQNIGSHVAENALESHSPFA